MRAASALSEHPLATHAVGEIAGNIMEAFQGEPIDLLVMFVEGSHTGAVEDINNALRDLLQPRHSMGSTASGVISNEQEVEFRSSISIWAAAGLTAVPFRINSGATSPTSGWPRQSGHSLLLADPFSIPVDALFEDAATNAPDLSLYLSLIHI